MTGLKRLAGLFVLVVSLSACGDDSNGTSPMNAQPSSAPTTRTLAEQISDLESAGKLPKLDRSASVLGPDTNADGVRDDIAAYVSALPYTVIQKASLNQLAKSMRSELNANLSDEAAMDATSLADTRAIHCIAIQFIGNPLTSEMVDMMQSLIGNTKDRAKAVIAHSNARDGTTSSVPLENTCE